MHPLMAWWVRMYHPRSKIAAMVGRWIVIYAVLVVFLQLLRCWWTGALMRAVQ